MGCFFRLLLALPPALAPLVSAAAFAGPSPTSSLDALHDLSGWTPKPTKAPTRFDLVRRDAQFQTCGFFTDNGPLSCDTSSTCMFYSSSPHFAAGCCSGGNIENCQWATTCVDFAAINSGKCDQECFRDPFGMFCEDSASPFCQASRYDNELLIRKLFANLSRSRGLTQGKA